MQPSLDTTLLEFSDEYQGVFRKELVETLDDNVYIVHRWHLTHVNSPTIMYEVEGRAPKGSKGLGKGGPKWTFVIRS